MVCVRVVNAWGRMVGDDTSHIGFIQIIMICGVHVPDCVERSCTPYFGLSPLGAVASYLCGLTKTLLGADSNRYTYMASLRRLSCTTSISPPSPIPWPECPTPVNIGRLAGYLHSHPDQEFAQFVLRGLSRGFHVGFNLQEGKSLRSSHRVHPSVSASPQAVSQYIADETAKGRMVGPLPDTIQRLVHCSPIGLVPKGRNTGLWRMIVDLSFPEDGSVNDGIDAELCSLRYSSIDDALKFIMTLGPGTQLIKVDLKSAYRIVPIHPDDRHLLGICWEGSVYVDNALPFWLRSAPKLFMAVADAVGWALTRTGTPYLIHYLDDFLFFVPPSVGSPSALLSRSEDVV